VLRPGDEPLVEAFCALHTDTTLFFRNNLQQAGLSDRGRRYEGTYAAAFEGGAVCALAAHFWNGNIILEAPTRLAEVVATAVRASGRPLKGFIGQAQQAEAARASLGLEDAPAIMESREILFGLQLTDLRVPALLSEGRAVCRRRTEADHPLLVAWRIAYSVESLGEADTPAMRARVEESLTHRSDDGRLWLLEHEGRPVAMTAFNAAVPQAVQVGGVYTPPPLRSRGYGAAAVAGSLLEARARGVPRSILFTAPENLPAQACYRGLGYRRIGDYGLILLADGQRVVV